MGVSKVVLGDETLVDLTSDTVSTENLLQGATAHGADGEEVIGGVVVTPMYTGTKTAIEEAIAAGQIPEDAIVNITDDEEESSFQTQINELNGKLQNENNETFNFGIKDGVRGFYTNPSRGDDTFIPFKNGQPVVYLHEKTNRVVNTTVDFTLKKGTYIMYLFAYGANGSTYIDVYDNITELTGANYTKIDSNMYQLVVSEDESNISVTFESGTSNTAKSRTAYVVIVI